MSAMRIEFETTLLEETVFQALRGGTPEQRALESAYRRDADTLYSLPSGPAREEAFLGLQSKTFSKLGLREHIDAVFAHFPVLASRLERAIFLLAPLRKDQDAELFGGSGHAFNMFVRTTAATLIDPQAFARFAHHEFSHIADMLDSKFEYSRTPQFAGVNSVQREIARERYRELWDLYIDARLLQAGKPAQQERQGHFFNFIRLFGESALTREIFEQLWTLDFATPPSQPAFIAAAGSPEALCALAGLSFPQQADAIRTFATVCPVCACATKVWVNEPATLNTEIQARIVARVPSWTPEKGLCVQCSEFFALPPAEALAEA